DAAVAGFPLRFDAIKTILAQQPGGQIIVNDDGFKPYPLARGVGNVVFYGGGRFWHGRGLSAGAKGGGGGG
ncbi:hypothetical protein Q2475_27575, partial [Escherichia coli]|nr:hypothetical protein [Escherichia coli]